MKTEQMVRRVSHWLVIGIAATGLGCGMAWAQGGSQYPEQQDDAPPPASVPSSNPNGANLQRFRCTVTNDLGHNMFEVRNQQGETLRLVFEDSTDHGIDVGDKISVHGYRDGSVLIAHRVRVLDDDAGQGAGALAGLPSPAGSTVQGTVVRLYRGSQFQLRDSSGHLVMVDAGGAPYANIAPGDNLELQGNWAGGMFKAQVLRELGVGPTGAPPVSNYQHPINFPATVTAMPGANSLMVRGDNGQTYTVTTRADAPPLNMGDRVQLIGGLAQDGTTIIDQVVPIGASVAGAAAAPYGSPNNQGYAPNNGGSGYAPNPPPSYNPNAGQPSGNNNGPGYAPNAGPLNNGNPAPGYNQNGGPSPANNGPGNAPGNDGDDDAPNGPGPNGPGNGGQAGGQQVSFPGVVQSIQVSSGSLYVKGDNGQTYLVKYPNPGQFAVNDHVRVSGAADNQGIVNAASVSRQ